MRNYRLIRVSSLCLPVRAITIAKENNIKTVGGFIDLIEDIKLNGKRRYSHRLIGKRITEDIYSAIADYINK